MKTGWQRVIGAIWLTGLLSFPACQKQVETDDAVVVRREFVDQARMLHRELQTIRRAAGQQPTASFPDIARDFAPLRAEEARSVLGALQAETFLLATDHLRQVPPDWTSCDLLLSLRTGVETAFDVPFPGRPLALRLTNSSRTLLPAPFFFFNRSPDWSSLENLLANALAGNSESARDQAIALFGFVVRARTHGLPAHPGDELHDPVRWLNSYGYGFCDDAATTLVQLARAVGLEARALDLQGHVVAEVLIDGKWSVLDPDGEVFYPLPDGSLAAVAEITPSLLKEYPSPTQALDYLQSLYARPERHRHLDERRFEIPVLPLDRTLRPGESFLLSTKPTGWFFSSAFFAEPPEYGSGEWSFAPVLAEEIFALGAEEAVGWIASSEHDVPWLAAAPDHEHAVLIYRIVSPYPMLHGSFSVRAELDSSARLLLDWRTPDGEWSSPVEFASGRVDLQGQMPAIFTHGQGDPTREIHVRVRMLDGGASRIHDLRWTIGIQVAPRSLPEFPAGTNTVTLQTSPPAESPLTACLEFFWAE